MLSVALKKQTDGRNSCCYQITLSNKLPAHAKLFPSAFQVSISSGNITDVYAASNTWTQKPQTVPPKTKTIVWNHISSKIPRGKTDVATLCVEGLAPVWLQYAWLDRTGKVLCRDSVKLEGCIIEPTELCENQLIRNGEFTIKVGAAMFWAKGYGNPKFLDTPNKGFFDPGYVEMSGNMTTGAAVVQALLPANKIELKKKYLLSVGVRFFSKSNTLDYARIRAVAFNGSLPTTGTHPTPSANIAIIGRSGKIRDCNDWSVIEFPVWVANKDFQNIAINVFTNDGTASVLWIDNVSLCEVALGGDCDEVQRDAKGNPIIPAGYGAVPPGFTCQPEIEEDEYDNGSLQDLYGQLYGYDGTTNWYTQASDKCFSIGGTLPAEVINYNCDDSLKMAGIKMTCDELQRMVEDPDVDIFDLDSLPYLPPIEKLSRDTACKPLPDDIGNVAFRGKDIIYVHGLELGHLVSRILNIPLGAASNWPQDQSEFYGTGYYKDAAEKTWDDHIRYFALGKNYKNRYLVVAYNCSQRMEVAVHSVLSQIRVAMETGRGVRNPNPEDPRGTACFARDYVIISQSTGAIVADVALAIANNTKTDPNLAAQYGNIGLIADRCKGHIARRGAFTGSDLATILVGLGNQPSPTATILATAFVLQKNDPIINVNFNYPVIRQSILVDLIPKITRKKWGPYSDQVPVPVLTIAGGHPSFFSQNDLAFTNLSPLLGIPPSAAQSAALGMKYTVHPGYDDGVITMDCATGRKNTFASQSYFSTNNVLKVFDMGIKKPRAISYFIDQRMPFNPLKFGAASTPYLSPTGMVQPVSSVTLNQPYNNHYAFIQAASEHWIKKDLGCCDYKTTAIGGSSNNEEELVVENAGLFHSTTGIIDPAIIAEMGETIKGQIILLPSIKLRYVRGIPRPVIYWKKFYIWKRTYHKFRNDGLYDCDYIYQYLFRN
ncbi:MAG: hypothetical protein H7246_07395 [Phycisphaerae bacterium]|nr:hypothetical protein [Saprospiraceae bacterium]